MVPRSGFLPGAKPHGLVTAAQSSDHDLGCTFKFSVLTDFRHGGSILTAFSAMRSYVASCESDLHLEIVEQRAERSRRPLRAVLIACLTAVACVALLTIAGDEGHPDSRSVLKPKFVDWKKEDAGSEDMNLHLRVAESLAKADGVSEKGPMPVSENLLKEAQQAAEEQKSMPAVDVRLKKLLLPASLEKMFQQAKDEQEVEKLAKEGDQKVQRDDQAVKKANVKEAAQKKAATAKARAQEDKAGALKLLSQVAKDAAAPMKKTALSHVAKKAVPAKGDSTK